VIISDDRQLAQPEYTVRSSDISYNTTFESCLNRLFAISSETARRTAAKFCTQTRAVCVTHGLGLKYVDRGHRWEENEMFVELHFTPCCGTLQNGDCFKRYPMVGLSHAVLTCPSPSSHPAGRY